MTLFNRFSKDNRGVTSVEYALLCAACALTFATAAAQLTSTMSGRLEAQSGTLDLDSVTNALGAGASGGGSSQGGDSGAGDGDDGGGSGSGSDNGDSDDNDSGYGYGYGGYGGYGGHGGHHGGGYGYR